MKVELIGINREEFFKPASNAAPTVAVNEPPTPERVVLAKLANLDGAPYSFIQVPVEMVGANPEIGDVFTLHLERAR